MQFWPRVRAKRQYPRIRSWTTTDKAMFLAFPCYKAGMTHASGIDNRKFGPTKNEEISFPVTIVECPPFHIISIRFYHTPYDSKKVALEFSFKPPKDVTRKILAAKKYADLKDLDKLDLSKYQEVTAIIATTPRAIKLKKTPEIFEVHVGGADLKTQLDFLKEHVGKDIRMNAVFDEGQFVDVHGITTGKGTQGPVKRFGIALKGHKSEKSRRQPGSLGGWTAQGHVMYRVAHAGQMGYHQRVEYNKQVIKMGNKPEEVNPKGAFLHYGQIIGDYAIIKGSIIGPAKRMLLLTKTIRIPRTTPNPTITYLSQNSKQ